MTTATDLPALIAELEAATAGSSAFDRRIMLFEGWTENDPDEPASMWRAPKGRTYVLGGHVGVTAVSGAYPYTRSVDAALTLLPEGWWVRVDICRNSLVPADDVAHCRLERDADIAGRDLADHEPMDIAGLNCRSAPLAICIAALKARLHNSTPVPA